MAHEEDRTEGRPGDGEEGSQLSDSFGDLRSQLQDHFERAREQLSEAGSALLDLVETARSRVDEAGEQVSQRERDLARQEEELRQTAAAAEEAPAAAKSEAPPADGDHLRSAVEEIDAAANQAEVLSRLLEQSCRFGSRAVLLLGEDASAQDEGRATLKVWNAVGFGDPAPAGRQVQVPGSWIDVLAARNTVLAHGEEAGELADALGAGPPEHALVAPFILRDNAYAVYYVDAVADPDHAAFDTAALQILGFVASQAMECLAVRSARPSAAITAPTVLGAPAPAEDREAEAPPAEETAEESAPGEFGAAEAEPEAPAAETGAAEQSATEDDAVAGLSAPTFFSSTPLEAPPDVETVGGGSADEAEFQPEADSGDGPATPLTVDALPAEDADAGEVSAAEVDESDSAQSLPWPSGTAAVEEPAPELLESTGPAEAEGEDDRSEGDRGEGDGAAPWRVSEEPETPSHGLRTSDSPEAEEEEVGADEDGVERSSSFISAIDPSEAADADVPPPPPTPAGSDAGARSDQPSAPALPQPGEGEDQTPAAAFSPPTEPDTTEPTTVPPAPPVLEPDSPAPQWEPSAEEATGEENAAPPEQPSTATPPPPPPAFPADDSPSSSSGIPRPPVLDSLQSPPDQERTPGPAETVVVPEQVPEPPAEPEPEPPPSTTPEPQSSVSDVEQPEISVPRTPPTTAPGTSEVRPPQDHDGPGHAFERSTEGGEDPRDEEARRLARLLVSELKLYNEEEIAKGKRQGNIYQHLREDIDRSRRIYDERIDPEVRQRTDFLHEELVRGLADGDPQLLGL